MYKLKKIKLQNFLSINEAEVNFELLKYPLLVTGINEDLGRSNGAGKTTIFNGICFALFGKIPYSIPVALFDNSIAILSLQSDTTEIEISRSRKNGTESLSFKENGNIIEGNTATQTQQMLNTFFGYKRGLADKEIFQEFLTSVYFSKGTVDILASNDYTPSERMELICRMLNLSYWEDAIDGASFSKKNSKETLKIKNDLLNHYKNSGGISLTEVQKQITEYENQIKTLKNEIKYSEKEYERYETLIKNKDSVQNNLDNVNRNIATARHNYQNNTNLITSTIVNHQDTIIEAEDWLDKAKDLSKVDAIGVEFPMIQERIKILRDFIRDATELKMKLSNKNHDKNNEIIFTERDLRDKKISLETGLSCPSCKADLMLKKGTLDFVDKKYIQSEITVIERKLELLKEEKSRMDIDYKTADEHWVELKEEKIEMNKRLEISQTLEIWKNNITIALQNIQKEEYKIKLEEEKHNEELKKLNLEKENLKKQLSDSSICADETTAKKAIEITNLIRSNQIKLQEITKNIGILEEKYKNIKENTKNIQEIKINLNEAQNTLNKSSFWVDGFKTIKTSIVDNFIPILNVLTNDNIKKMGMDFICEIDTLRKTNKGDLIQEFNITIMDNQMKTRPVMSFSDGERRTLAICVALAMRSYKIQSRLMPFSFLLFDEVFDGIDEKGQQDILNYLNKNEDQNIIISHSDIIKGQFNSNIVAIKKDGVTTIRS